MFEILSKPYDLLEHPRFRFLLTFGAAIFVFIFILIFRPFGLHKLYFPELMSILFPYFICGLPISAIHIYYLQNIVIKKFTVGNTILWLLWIYFLIGISGYIVNTFLFFGGEFYFSNFVNLLTVFFIETAIPIAIIVLLHYNFLVKRRLMKAEEINTLLKKRTIDQSIQYITIPSNSPGHSLELPLDSLLYITSADNYIDVFFFDSEQVKHVLLRNTLTSICEIFADMPMLFRCHKSHVVNIRMVESLIGNSTGYKLQMKTYQKLIPVSRKFNKEIKGLLNV
jgi:hypothetical protein